MKMDARRISTARGDSRGVAEPAGAYCPMHKRSWLQPDGEIGNPYGGMPRCGEIVAK